jgi:hypothetical protein
MPRIQTGKWGLFTVGTSLWLGGVDVSRKASIVHGLAAVPDPRLVAPRAIARGAPRAANGCDHTVQTAQRRFPQAGFQVGQTDPCSGTSARQPNS